MRLQACCWCVAAAYPLHTNMSCRSSMGFAASSAHMQRACCLTQGAHQGFTQAHHEFWSDKSYTFRITEAPI